MTLTGKSNIIANIVGDYTNYSALTRTVAIKTACEKKLYFCKSVLEIDRYYSKMLLFEYAMNEMLLFF